MARLHLFEIEDQQWHRGSLHVDEDRTGGVLRARRAEEDDVVVAGADGLGARLEEDAARGREAREATVRGRHGDALGTDALQDDPTRLAAGMPDSAMRHVEEFTADYQAGGGGAVQIGMAYGLAGRSDEAFEWLNRAVDDSDGWIFFLNTMSALGCFDSLIRFPATTTLATHSSANKREH